jgi:hypothetical protein
MKARNVLPFLDLKNFKVTPNSARKSSLNEYYDAMPPRTS